MDKEKLLEHETQCENRFPKKVIDPNLVIKDWEEGEDSEPEDLSFKRYGCTSSKMLNMTEQEQRRMKNIMARYQDNFHDKHLNPLQFEIYNPKRRNWDQTI